MYLDYAASAPLLPEARAALLAALDLGPGNPSSAHRAGRRLRRCLEDAREQVAAAVGAQPSEVVFTSGTSESNALAVRGVLAARPEAGNLVRTSADHPSLEEAARAAAPPGLDVRIAVAAADGVLSAAALLEHIDSETALVALPLVQSETGARLPAEEIAARLNAASGPRPTLLIDGAQAVGHEPVDVAAAAFDLLSFSAHKLGGPRGIGALIVRAGVPFRPAGPRVAQERGRRPGTEAVALAAAFAAAAAHAARHATAAGARNRATLAPLVEWIRGRDDVVLLSPPDHVPHIALLACDGCPGEALTAALDAVGICVSAGAACASQARTPPHVLLAAGMSAERAREACRVSIGDATRHDEIVALTQALDEIIPRVRAAFTPPPGTREKTQQHRASQKKHAPPPSL